MKNTLFILSFFVFLNFVYSAVSDIRNKDQRESFVLKTAIELYTLTHKLRDEITNTLSTHVLKYEAIFNKEGVTVHNEMNELEEQLEEIIRTIKSEGGIFPINDNFTAEVDMVSRTLKLEYNIFLENVKVYVEKMKEALESVLVEKKNLVSKAEKCTELRKKYESYRWILEQEDIFLRNPKKVNKSITSIDISVVLEKLLGYYKQLDELENNLEPLLKKYKSFADIEHFSKDDELVKESAAIATPLNEEIRNLIESKDEMLRHYDLVINVEIEKMLKVASEKQTEYDELKEKLVRDAQSSMEQDIRIRQLSKEFNNHLRKANELSAELEYKFSDIDRDEL